MDYSNLKIPNHVAIIVDGNGRWAKEKGMTRSQGHDAGFENLKDIATYIFEKGSKVLSVYVFSTENFKRDKAEVDHLMNLFCMMFEKDKNFFMRNNIKVVFSGRDEPLPQKVIDCRNKLSEMTKDNTGGIFNVCLNYGGRAEIVDACKKLINEGIPAEEITEEVFHEHLYQNLPDVDLLIRTSGEVRLSNYLLWELSYAEFIFYPEKFPGFTRDDYDKCVVEFTRRDRRFGGIKEN